VACTRFRRDRVRFSPRAFAPILPIVERVMGGLLVLTGIGFARVFTQLNSWLIETFPALQSIG
jgi:hypothetical protein